MRHHSPWWMDKNGEARAIGSPCGGWYIQSGRAPVPLRMPVNRLPGSNRLLNGWFQFGLLTMSPWGSGGRSSSQTVCGDEAFVCGAAAAGAAGKAHESRLLWSSSAGRNHDEVVPCSCMVMVQLLRKRPGESLVMRPANWLSLRRRRQIFSPASSAPGIVPPRRLCWAAKTWSLVRFVAHMSGIVPSNWLACR